MTIFRLGCCGIGELSNFTDPKNSVCYVAGEIANYRFNGTYIIFSRTGVSGGKPLADYITEHKLGELTTLGAKQNPNSGNALKVWLWKIDRRALLKHSKTHL